MLPVPSRPVPRDSRILGVWRCDDGPILIYRADGTGTDHEGPFTYQFYGATSIERGIREPTQTTEWHIVIKGRRLYKRSSGFWHDGGWAAFPTGSQMDCRRGRNH